MKMIVAADEKWAIGRNGDLLTPLPEDMKFFRETTMNSVVILGRKTLETFPGGKPLKNRVNIVISANKDFNAEGIVKVSSVEEAVEESKKYTDKEVFVVGGGTIYRQMLRYCDTAYITKIEKIFEDADTFIDNLDVLDEWEVVSQSDKKEYEGTVFSFVTYKRK